MTWVAEPLSKRLLAKIAVQPDGCWLWTASFRPDGYGQIWTSVDEAGHRRLLSAHRAVWEEIRGPIPDGMDLDHLCRVLACVNPDHMEPVTRRENILRGDAPPARNARQRVCRRAGHALRPCPRPSMSKLDHRCCPCRHDHEAVSAA